MTSREFSAAVLAVIGTMEDCKAECLPCVASSIYLALESRGLPGARVLEAMTMAGFIQFNSGAGVVEPGAHYERVAELVRRLLPKREVTK